MSAKLRLPVLLVAIDIVGIALAALGLAGLFTNAAHMLPFLADRGVAGTLAAIGFALVTFALGNIMRWRRLAAGAQAQAADPSTPAD